MLSVILEALGWESEELFNATYWHKGTQALRSDATDVTPDVMTALGWTRTMVTGQYVYTGTPWSYSIHDKRVYHDTEYVCTMLDAKQLIHFMYGVGLCK